MDTKKKFSLTVAGKETTLICENCLFQDDDLWLVSIPYKRAYFKDISYASFYSNKLKISKKRDESMTLTSQQRQLRQYAKATLGTTNLREAVKLPEGEDLYEWLSLHTIDFFNHINMLYATLSESCTKESCIVMTAGRYEYHWCDGVNYKKPTPLSAPEYIEQLLAWIQSQLDDITLFPSDFGNDGDLVSSLNIESDVVDFFFFFFFCF
jgi:hypothetical protein